MDVRINILEMHNFFIGMLFICFMSRLKARINGFLDSGAKLDELSFEEMASWVKLDNLKSFSAIYQGKWGAFFFKAGENQLLLTQEKISLQIESGESKFYQGVDVKKLYDSFYDKVNA